MKHDSGNALGAHQSLCPPSLNSLPFSGLPWHGHVTALTVSPEFRRLGLAGNLMGILEEASEAKDCIFIDLFVRVSNDVAVSMYKKLGYEVWWIFAEMCACYGKLNQVEIGH